MAVVRVKYIGCSSSAWGACTHNVIASGLVECVSILYLVPHSALIALRRATMALRCARLARCDSWFASLYLLGIVNSCSASTRAWCALRV
jgi:hypothetical protein